MAKIVVRCSPNGTVKVEADGVVGSSCQNITKPLIDALGSEGDSSMKPEFYESVEQQQQQGQNQW